MAVVPPIVNAQVQAFLQQLPQYAGNGPNRRRDLNASVRDLVQELGPNPAPNIPVFDFDRIDDAPTFNDTVVHLVDDIPLDSILIPRIIQEVDAIRPQDVVAHYRLDRNQEYYRNPDILERYKATLIIERYPAVARIIALISTGSEGTRFAPFRWGQAQANNVIPWDAPTIERVLNPLLAVPGNTAFRGRGNLISTLRDMQTPAYICLALYCMYLILEFPNNQNLVMSVSMDTLTKRHIENDNNEWEVSLQPRRTAILDITSQVDDPQGIVDLYKNIVVLVLSTVKSSANGAGRYNIDEDYDQAFITAVNITYTLPNAANAHAINFPLTAKNDVRQFLYGLYAYAVPKELRDHPKYKLLTVYQPESEDNQCVSKAYAYYRLLRNGRMTEDQPQKHHMINSASQALIRGCQLDGSTPVMEYLDALMACDAANPSVLGQGPIKLHVMFMNTLAIPSKPLFPSVKIQWIDGEPKFEVPSSDKYLFEDTSADEYVLVYFKAHIFVSRYGMIKDMIDARGSIWDRIESAVMTSEPPCDIVIPRRVLPLTAKDLMDEQHPKWHCIDERLNVRKHAADVETDRCPVCSSEHKDVQEAFCAALVTGFEETALFYGQQCHSVKDTLETSSGCIAQMLRHLIMIGKSRKRSTEKRKEYVYFYNGANFDVMFVMKTLNYYNEIFEIIPQGSSILRLKWRQFYFVDFMRLYVPAKLSKMYEAFQKFHLPEVDKFKPVDNKWKTYPYKLVGANRDYTDAELDDPAIWEGCTKINEDDARPIHEQCLEWWRSKHGDIGYLHQEHLLDYCLDDTYILFYMVYVDAKVLARGSVKKTLQDGSVKERHYNVSDKLTAASRSVALFRQAFQDLSLRPPRILPTEVFDVKAQRNLRIDEVIKLSYLGGIVQCYRKSLHSDADLVQRYKEIDQVLTADEYDFNSMYPFVMSEYEIPISYEGEMTYDEPIESTAESHYTDYHLYKVDMLYPPGKDGTITKYRGYTVALTHIPSEYNDPAFPHTLRHNFRWGVELNEALLQGCRIKVFAVFKFAAYKIFSDFAFYCHEMRLQDKKGLLGTFWKLMSNSQYGKWAEKEHASCYIVHNIVDVPVLPKGKIVDIRFIGRSVDNRPLYMVQKLCEGQIAGQHRAMSSFITAAARTRLLMMKRIVETEVYTHLGTPSIAFYCDTDSWKILKPDWSHLNSQLWFNKWVHPSRLGALKSETDDTGYDEGYFLAKKVNVMRSYNADLMADAEYTVKAKGMNKKNINPKDMIALARGEVTSLKIAIPLKFIRSFEDGILKITNDQRTLMAVDRSRKPPDAKGICAPFANIAEFDESLKMFV